MIELNIPGRNSYLFEHLVLDLNGTITLDGEVVDGVEERLEKLGKVLKIHLVTADTLGTAQKSSEIFKIKLHKIDKGPEDAMKLELVQELGKEKTVCIGNGLNDVLMLENSALGICVIGQEGAATETILASDIAVNSINDALDLLLNPDRVVATLRT